MGIIPSTYWHWCTAMLIKSKLSKTFYNQETKKKHQWCPQNWVYLNSLIHSINLGQCWGRSGTCWRLHTRSHFISIHMHSHLRQFRLINLHLVTFFGGEKKQPGGSIATRDSCIQTHVDLKKTKSTLPLLDLYNSLGYKQILSKYKYYNNQSSLY